MKLSKIRMEDFGPYIGKQEIDLTVSESAPVIVVYGENFHGKTSLLRALRWCLYGEALDQHQKPLPFKELVNYDIQRDGQWLTSVNIEFIHEGHDYELMRQIQADREPLLDSDFQMLKSLRVDGKFVPEAEIDDVIAGILHKDISTFFLFDGEMLNRYEDLLSDDDGSALIIRQSIEQILGLPALQSIHDDLSDLEGAAAQKQRRTLEAQRRDVSLANDAEKLASERDSIKRDLHELNELLRKEQGDKEGYRAALARYSEIANQAHELGELRHDLDQLERQRRDAQSACREILTEQWWIALTPLAKDQLATAEAELDDATRTAAKREEGYRLSAALENDVCPTCGGPLDHARHKYVSERLAELGASTENDGGGERLITLSADVQRLRDLAQGRVDALVYSEHEYRRLGVELRRKRRRVETIEEVLRKHEIEEVSTLQHKYDEVVRRISDIQKDIVGRQSALAETEKNLRKKQSQIRESPGADPRTVAEAAAYEALKDIFEQAIDRFRVKLREGVQAQATRVFKNLISASDLNKLEINDQYGLSIVTDDGTVLTTRSAGTSQIVALSLIGALNKCALREGPVVMDTPFGRLDRGHRSNVLNYVAHLGPQVILLVQSGEFERNRDLKTLGTRVAHEYELARVDGKSTRTEVRRLD